MQCSARSRVWMQRLVLSATVALVALTGFNITPRGAPAVTAAEARTASVPAALPEPANPPPYVSYLPIMTFQPVQTADVFGVQMYGPLNSSDAALDLAQTAGVSWVRSPFSWGGIEPSATTPQHYNWSDTDTDFAAAKAAGFNIIATMASNPSWAATYAAGRLDRSGLAPFVEFMAAVVERYDGDGVDDAPGSVVVNYWELYNEPDGGDPIRARYGAGYWGHYGADYAQMLCAVYPAMKAADPNARIVLGGVAHDWFEEDGGPFVRSFLDDVLAAGGGRCIDTLAFHYYPPFEQVWAPYGPGLSGKTNYLRSKLLSYGHGAVPLLVTEAGYHSNADPSWPSTPEIQAGYVVRLFTQAIASRITTMIWFSWTDLANYWAASGLLDMDRQPKLAYDALKAYQRKLGGMYYQRRLSDGESGSADVEAYLFGGSSFPFYVVWTNGRLTKQVRLSGEIMRVSGLADETLAKVLDASDGSDDGLVTITAGSIPIYVEVLQ